MKGIIHHSKLSYDTSRSPVNAMHFVIDNDSMAGVLELSWWGKFFTGRSRAREILDSFFAEGPKKMDLVEIDCLNVRSMAPAFIQSMYEGLLDGGIKEVVWIHIPNNDQMLLIERIMGLYR